MRRFRFPLSTSVVIGVGLIVLLGYFIDSPELRLIREVLLQWGLILAAIALLVGIANLWQVHWSKVRYGQPGGAYSLLLLVSLVLTLGVVGFLRPTAPFSMWIFNAIQVPLESSFMALLAVVLAYAAARLLNRQLNLYTLLFLGTALVVILGTISLPGFDLPVISDGLRSLREGVSNVVSVAGARGILIGVALGTVATGLRILMGADRPYGG